MVISRHTFLNILAAIKVSFFVVFFSCLAPTLAFAVPEQVITPEPINQTLPGNAAVTVDVNYTTQNPSDETLTGLGLRIHFDSTKLTFVDLTETLATNLVGVEPPVDDSGDADGDANTDKFVLVAWADNIGAGWPGEGNTPVKLFTVNFVTTDEFSESTAVNFSKSSPLDSVATLSATSAMIDAANATTTIPVDPAGTFLFTDDGDPAAAPTTITLGDLGVGPGDEIGLRQLGAYQAGDGFDDDSVSMLGVFSDGAGQVISPGAGSSVEPEESLPTAIDGVVTDIPEDFAVVSTRQIAVVPAGAVSLHIGPNDSFFSDNSDPNGDYAVRITTFGDDPPEITFTRVQVQMRDNGAVFVSPLATVRDVNGIDTVTVTVEREGPDGFGPFLLRTGTFKGQNDSAIQDSFSENFGVSDIPEALWGGDYLFKAADAGSEFSATDTLPDGLTPLPPAGPITIDTSTGLETPTISANPVPGATHYRLSINNETDRTFSLFDGVPGPDFSTTPFFALTAGVLEAGKLYRIRVEAFDGPTNGGSNRRSIGPRTPYAPSSPPEIRSSRVQLRTEADGDVVVNTFASVEDLTGIDTVSVTVEREGPDGFGPFALSIGTFASPSDSAVRDGFSGSFGTDDIPEALRAGDYVFRATDGSSEASETRTLPSGLTPLPAAGPISIETSTGFATPTISADPVPGATHYRLNILNDTDTTASTFDGVSGSGLSTSPSFVLSSGILEPGKFYRIRLEAFDGPTAGSSDRRSNGPRTGYDPSTGSLNPPRVLSRQVYLRTQPDGEQVVHVRVRAEDLDGIDTVSVTVERDDVFGPFPVPFPTLTSASDSETRDSFLTNLDAGEIPADVRAGDYLFKLTDPNTGDFAVNTTRTLPSGLTALPPVGPVTVGQLDRVVYDNGPSEFGGGVLIDPTRTTADDFVVDSQIVFTAATFDAFKFGGTIGSTFTWYIYLDAGGKPGTILATGAAQNVLVSSQGQSGGRNHFRVDFEFGTALVLLPGTYWLGLDSPETDLWTHSAEQRGNSAHSLFSGDADWTKVPTGSSEKIDLKFTLIERFPDPGPLRPLLRADPVPEASHYRLLIRNDTDMTVTASGLSESTSFRPAAGILEAGKSYRLRIEAFDASTINDANLQSVSSDVVYSPATQVVITTPGADFAAGGSTNVTVQVQDAFGNLVSTDNGTQVTFTPTGNATIAAVLMGIGDGVFAGGAETVRVVGGVATVTLTDTVAETFSVAITNDIGLSNPADDSITVSAGGADRIVITDPGDDFIAGGSTMLTVEVRDALGNLASADNTTQITFVPTGNGAISNVLVGTGDGSFGVRGGAEAVTVAGGVATVTLTNAVAETFAVGIINAAGLANPPNDSITVTPLPATHLVVIDAGDDFLVGGTTTLSVEVRDASGARVSTDNTTPIKFGPTLNGTISDVVTGTLVLGSLGVPGGPVTVQVASGVATVILTNTVAETFEVAITNDVGLANPPNDIITVEVPPPPPTQIVVAVPGVDFLAGESTNLRVEVRDAFDNRVSRDDTTRITFGPTGEGTIANIVTGDGDGSFGVPGDAETVTVNNGIATVTLTSTVAETFAVAITNDGALVNPADDIIMVHPAAVSSFLVSGISDPVTAGTNSDVTVTALDRFGNTVTDYAGTIRFSSTDARAVLPADYTFTSADAGTRTFPGGVTLRTGGEQSVTAGDVASPIGGTQTGIMVQNLTAIDIALAMDIPEDRIVRASFDAEDFGGPADPAGAFVFTSPLAGFPVSNNSFAVLSTGAAADADLPNDVSVSTILDHQNNSEGNDLVRLQLTLNAPDNAIQWAVDWKFLSEEPTSGTGNNDAFLIETELGIGCGPSVFPPFEFNRFRVVSRTVEAPDNVAVGPNGQPVTIDTIGDLMTEASATETTYDAATETFTTVGQICPTDRRTTLIFSVTDLGDSDFDTTVFLDNFRFLFVQDLFSCDPGECPVVGETLKIPVRWCYVDGAGADVERFLGNNNPLDIVSDDIFEQATMTLTPAIIPSTSTATFPIRIDDQDLRPERSSSGDVFVPTINHPRFGTGDGGFEWRATMNECRRKWREAAPEVTGLTAVRIKRFIKESGAGSDLLGVGGLSVVGNAASQMAGGHVTIVDTRNKWLAHEFGHGLSLWHGDGRDNNRSGIIDGPPRGEDNSGADGLQAGNNLMQYRVSPDGIELTRAQIERMRAQARLIPDVVDPIGNTRSDILGDVPDGQDFADVNEFGMVVDSDLGLVYLFTNFNGLFPDDFTGTVVFVVDTDQDSSTGGDPSSIPGFPSGTGVDLITRVRVSGGEATNTEVFVFNEDTQQFTPLAPNMAGGIFSEVTTDSLFMEDVDTDGEIVDVSNGVSVEIPIEPLPVSPTGVDLQVNTREVVVDETGNEVELPIDGATAALTFEVLTAPFCQVNPALAAPTQTVDLTANDLPVNSPIRILFGLEEIAIIDSDGDGNATFSFDIPSNATVGRWPIRVRLDDPGRPITANCVVIVGHTPAFRAPPTPEAHTGFSVNPGEPVSFPVEAFDPDPGDVVILGAAELPAGANFETASATGTFSWTPTSVQVGTHVINFTATDNIGVSAEPYPIAIRVLAPSPEVINDLIQLGEVETGYDPRDSRAPAGVFTIESTFTNMSSNGLSEVSFEVVELSGGNRVLNATGDGGVGSRIEVPGTIESGETFTVTFEIGLQRASQFDFFVDAYGLSE